MSEVSLYLQETPVDAHHHTVEYARFVHPDISGGYVTKCAPNKPLK